MSFVITLLAMLGLVALAFLIFCAGVEFANKLIVEAAEKQQPYKIAGYGYVIITLVRRENKEVEK